MLNGTDDIDICEFMRNTEVATIRAIKMEQLREAWDVNATWAERILINPVVRKWQLTKCDQGYQSLQTRPEYVPGRIPSTWFELLGSGILALFSVCFNISLIVVTLRHIKEYKVCNWLLAFDAFCQLFIMSFFVANLFAFFIGTIDFRICMLTSAASIMGTFGALMTIYLISLERLLLILAPVRMSQLETPENVRRISAIAVCLATAYGIFMSYYLLFHVMSLLIILRYYGIMYCVLWSNNSDVINKSYGFVLLLLALLNYVIICGFLSWRYFSGTASGESIRRVLRAVFILSLVVLFGWLMFMFNNKINGFYWSALLWMYSLNPSTTSLTTPVSLNNFFTILVQVTTHWVGIVASAGAAPILYFCSTLYRNAYKELFSQYARTTTSQVVPLFIQRRNDENGTVRNTTA